MRGDSTKNGDFPCQSLSQKEKTTSVQHTKELLLRDVCSNFL